MEGSKENEKIASNIEDEGKCLHEIDKIPEDKTILSKNSSVDQAFLSHSNDTEGKSVQCKYNLSVNSEDKGIQCEVKEFPTGEDSVIDDATEKQTFSSNSSVTEEKSIQCETHPSRAIEEKAVQCEVHPSRAIEEKGVQYETDPISINKDKGIQWERSLSSASDEYVNVNYVSILDDIQGNVDISTVSSCSPESAEISDKYNYNESERTFLDNMQEMLNEINKLQKTEVLPDDGFNDENVPRNTKKGNYEIAKCLISSVLLVLSALCKSLYELMFSPRIPGDNNYQNANTESTENKSLENWKSEGIYCSLETVTGVAEDETGTEIFSDGTTSSYDSLKGELKGKEDEYEAQSNEGSLRNDKDVDNFLTIKLPTNRDFSKTESVNIVTTVNENESLNTVNFSNTIHEIDSEVKHNSEAMISVNDLKMQEIVPQLISKIQKSDEDSNSPETTLHSQTNAGIKYASTQDVTKSIDIISKDENSLKCISNISKSSEDFNKKNQDDENSDKKEIVNRATFKENAHQVDNADIVHPQTRRESSKVNISKDKYHNSSYKKKPADISGDASSSIAAKDGKQKIHANEDAYEKASKQSISSSNFPETESLPVANLGSKEIYHLDHTADTEGRLKANDIKLRYGKFNLGINLDESNDFGFSYSCTQLVTNDKLVTKHIFQASKSKRK